MIRAILLAVALSACTTTDPEPSIPSCADVGCPSVGVPDLHCDPQTEICTCTVDPTMPVECMFTADGEAK